MAGGSVLLAHNPPKWVNFARRFTTIADLAREEGISDRYVSRVIRLAWLAPSVLERLVLRREPTVLSIFDLCGVAELPWVEQAGRVFD